MKILVVGGGGREHALCWKIAQSELVDEVICAPGNAGIQNIAKCFPVSVENLEGLRKLALEEKADLTVVGPEVPLCAGIADYFAEEGLKVFGPSKAAAEVEGDKLFARELCKRNRIPSPSFWSYEVAAHAKAFLENREEGPLVVKAAGLAAGKGVTVAKNIAEARAAVQESMEQERFGAAGGRVVIEECLEGPEVSVMCITDGQTIIPLEPARDHKPINDGDQGPNTGGMGALSPVPSVRPRILEQIESQVLLPAVHGLNQEERPFKGFLYAGLMLTAAGPKVLEFNARLGDPETQPLLMRLESDIVPYLIHTADGTLDQLEAPQWDPRPCVCVMATSEGYPGEYRKSLPIYGLDSIEEGPDLQVFHSGTRRKGLDVLTNGGRVLSVCARADTVEQAREKAYAALEKIEFQGMHFRKDIGKRA